MASGDCGGPSTSGGSRRPARVSGPPPQTLESYNPRRPTTPVYPLAPGRLCPSCSPPQPPGWSPTGSPRPSPTARRRRRPAKASSSAAAARSTSRRRGCVSGCFGGPGASCRSSCGKVTAGGWTRRSVTSSARSARPASPPTASAAATPSGGWALWELKPYAILHSPFEEVLALDAGTVVSTDPTSLFGAAEYRREGAVFWPDSGCLPAGHSIWTFAGWRTGASPNSTPARSSCTSRGAGPASAQHAPQRVQRLLLPVRLRRQRDVPHGVADVGTRLRDDPLPAPQRRRRLLAARLSRRARLRARGGRGG